MEGFILKNLYLGVIIIFSGMLISNIFPIMIFFIPDIFIFLGIFLAKHINWYIPYLAIILGAIIGEMISFYIGYKGGEKILKNKFLQKDISQTYIKKIRNNPIKTIILGKLIPGVIWIIPILAGIIKFNPLKFFIINSIMIILAISNMFLIWYFGISIGEKYLGNKIWIIIGVTLLLFLIYHTFKIIKKTRNKS